MIKPSKLQMGDTIATISPSWGCAGAARVKWKYELGVQRLRELGLNVVAAPNSLRGTSYLRNNPQARAEDVMWAFENKAIKGVLANIGGNDANKLIPFLNAETILKNPKILCGYSDVMTLHLYCYKLGLSTFYGDNLLTTIAEAQGWHPYSRYWFQKVLMDSSPIGEIPPSKDWTFEPNNHTNPQYVRAYIYNSPYMRIQGKGKVSGRLFGGHGDIIHSNHLGIPLQNTDFEGKIFFFEDIPEMCSVEYIQNIFDWLGKEGILQVIEGVIIGKIGVIGSIEPYAKAIRQIVSDKYQLPDLPIMYGLNFGHSSPICILPYGAMAELDIDNRKLTILESGVM